MKRKLISFATAALMLCCMALGTGAAPAQKVELSDWNGVWNSLDTYLEYPELDGAYKTLAAREGTTPEEIKAGFTKRYDSEVVAMKVDGDIITVYNKVRAFHHQDLKEDIVYSAQYVFKGEMPTSAGYTWYRFEAVNRYDVPYPVLMLLPVGEDEPGETMRHFHFRYGGDADELYAIQNWFPTMVKSSSTLDLISNDFTLE